MSLGTGGLSDIARETGKPEVLLWLISALQSLVLSTNVTELVVLEGRR